MRPRCLIGWAAVVLPMCGAAVPALGDGFVQELKLGILDHDVPDLWSGFRAEPDSVDINIEALLSPSALFLGGAVRPALGGTINTVGATRMPSGIFFGLGIGGAVHNGQLQFEDPDLKALGSRVLFHIPIEIGYRFDAHCSLSAYFEHTSNAFIVEPNEGLDRLGVRYGYRF